MSLIKLPEQDQECCVRPIASQFGLAFVSSALLPVFLGQVAGFRPIAPVVLVGHRAEHVGRRFPWSWLSFRTQSHNRHPSSGQLLAVQAC